MKQIELTQGKVALVDDDLYEHLNQWSWRADKRQNTFYAVRHPGILMHRLIAELRGLSLDGDTDHRDGNGLNNQTSNLRPATRQQNQANRSPQRNNTSGFKGVFWHKHRKAWQASIQVGGKAHTSWAL